jgi:hypothetical protein
LHHPSSLQLLQTVLAFCYRFGLHQAFYYKFDVFKH